MTTITTREIPQHMAALARANHIRVTNARLRERLGSQPRAKGSAELAEIIRSTDIEEYLRAEVGYLLVSVRSRGGSWSGKICRRLRISETRRLGDLTDRQRRMLAAAIEIPITEVQTRTRTGGFEELAA